MRSLLAPLILAAIALPVNAQFAVSVQQNGQASTVSNGGSITMNAPAVGQNAVVTVAITYIGTATASFPGAGQLLGSNFSVSGDLPATLGPLQSTTFTLTYLPTGTAQAAGDFLWPFSEVSSGMTLDSGAISFNLIGTAPNLTVGEITATGSFQIVASGGTIQFPSTSVNAVSSITVGLTNTGSGPATVNSITVAGSGYQLGGVPVLPVTVNAGTELNFTVQFQPASIGTVPGSLQIALANGTYAATLSGTGVASLLTYTVTQGGTASPVSPGQTITLGSTQVGSSSSAIVQFQNVGATALVLSTLAVSGTAFSITDGPFLPVTIQPQQSASITVTYTPTAPGSSSGRLLIGSDSFVLAAQALGALLTFSYEVGGTTVALSPGGTISFPTVAEGQTASVRFSIANSGTTVAPLASIGIVDPTGTFTLASVPALPLQLNPAAVATFTINFAPLSVGILSATLGINNQGFGLTGFSTAPPPLPSYRFTGASGTQQPFAQPAIGLSLNSPYSIALAGTLTITIVSSSYVADPAVQFSSGGQKVAFTIPPNTLSAIFPNGATQIQLQSGTVAGSIQITPDFTVGSASGTDITPSNPVSLQLTVPSQAPTLLTAAISAQTTTSLTFAITGFSTTRSLENLTFQLTPASGFSLSKTNLTVDVTSASLLWFQSTESQSSGGQFTVEIPFTLSLGSGSTSTNLATAISAVSVSATNSTGTSNVLQAAVP